MLIIDVRKMNSRAFFGIFGRTPELVVIFSPGGRIFFC